MQNGRRLTRIDDEILKEISNIIRQDIKDPRVNTITSVIKVKTTNDLKYCKIYISVLGDDEKKKEVMTALKSATNFIRKLVAMRINLRFTPELKFILDDSIEYGMKISKIIDDINNQEKPFENEEDS